LDHIYHDMKDLQWISTFHNRRNMKCNVSVRLIILLPWRGVKAFEGCKIWKWIKVKCIWITFMTCMTTSFHSKGKLRTIKLSKLRHLFIEVSVPSYKSEREWICVRWIDFSSFYDFSIWFSKSTDNMVYINIFNFIHPRDPKSFHRFGINGTLHNWSI
jgi:hypothetical protein